MGWNHRPLKSLLAPIEPEFFLSRIWGQGPLHIPAEAPGKFAELFDWDALNRVLNRGGEQARVHLVDQQINLYLSRTADHLRAIQRHLEQGATLILEEVDRQDPGLAAFLDALSAELEVDGFLNLYLSSPEHAGFGLHYDTHDFLVLQIDGYKDWEIYAPTLTDPLPHQKSSSQTPPPESDCLQRLRLSPGDVLYLPRGYWHRALARDTRSLHLTLGLVFPTGIDLLRQLLTVCAENPVFRRNLPLPGASWRPRLNELLAELNRLAAEPGLLPGIEQTRLASLSRRLAFALPHQSARQSDSLAAIRTYRVAELPRKLVTHPDGRLELIFPKASLSFGPEAQGLLQALLSQPQLDLDELVAASPGLSHAALLEMILPLVQHGLVMPEGG